MSWNEFAWSWLNSRTAEVCQDYHGQQAVNKPPSRLVARLIVTTLTILLSRIAISYILLTRSSNLRTVRHWGSDFAHAYTNSGYNNTSYTYTRVFCPCDKGVIPWPYFIQYFWVSQTPGAETRLKRHRIANYTEICNGLHTDGTAGKWINGCKDMAMSIMDPNDTRTYMESTSLLIPNVLAHVVGKGVRENVNQVFQSYNYLVSNYTADWMLLWKLTQMFSMFELRLLRSTRNLTDSNNTDFLYWRAFNGAMFGDTTAFELTGNRALALEIMWGRYVDQCSPRYCDDVVENKFARQLFVAVAEVGGFAALIVTFVRGCLWGLLKHLFRWEQFDL